jgi:RNA polymerase sigma-70 factor (ECF subfamily)
MPLDVADLYLKHGGMVFRRARAVVGDAELARDVVQEVFLVLHERQEAMREVGLVSWLYTATTNRSLKLVRDRANRARLLGENAERFLPGPVVAPDLAAEVRRLLPLLDEELAQVAVYRHLDEMTREEIAGLMDCSRRHVGNLIQRLESQFVTLRQAV